MPYQLYGSGITTAIIPVAFVLVGILLCFFGYRMFKVMLAIAGFILGFNLAS
ncbi:hypothetical protein GF359_08950, partial [candidate division WOR-3 bacterium]|nr:hypothetical protein [candidate division WOR-3 bacterium]MBD3365327.1 hypothetical protein [candidate division WOR-3 bacterium]